MRKVVISRFGEQPKTKIAWWAMGLGVSTVLIAPALGIFAAVIRPLIDKMSNENIGASAGFGFGIFALSLSVAALVTGICAFKKDERSWVLWVGFVPAILAGAFWVLMIAGEFVFPH